VNKELRMDSSAFHDAKQRMAALTKKRETEEKNPPTLRSKDEQCDGLWTRGSRQV
jgi:hypothetical protein